jgi:hypothetical protein
MKGDNTLRNKGANKEKTVLITGTTSGIGYELSKVFAREGFNLVLVSRNEQKLTKQKEELTKEYAIEVYTIGKDLSLPKAAEEVAFNVANKGIHVDILVNNAGFNESGPFQDTSLDKELQMLQVHVLVLTHLTKLFLPGMIKNKYGKILNLGSTGSFSPCPLDAVYCASKAYVLNFSNAIRVDLQGTGVTVSTLCPGATKTEFAKKADMEDTIMFKNFVMEPQTVADIAYRGLMKNKKVIIPGVYNQLLVSSIPMTPNIILGKISMWLLQHGKKASSDQGKTC